MGGCGMDGLMYGKVEPCNFLCHPYAADLLMLTVEVLSNSLEARRLTSIAVPTHLLTAGTSASMKSA